MVYNNNIALALYKFIHLYIIIIIIIKSISITMFFSGKNQETNSKMYYH